MAVSEQVRKVVNKCGGEAKVALALQVSVDTVKSWVHRSHSIPQKYWKQLSEIGGVTLAELAGWE